LNTKKRKYINRYFDEIYPTSNKEKIINYLKNNKSKVGALGLGFLGATAYRRAKKLRDSRSDKGKQRGKYNV
jgi:hypothetical protein